MTQYFVERPDGERSGAKRVWIVERTTLPTGATRLGDGVAVVRPGEVFHGVAYADLKSGEWNGPDPIRFIGP